MKQTCKIFMMVLVFMFIFEIPFIHLTSRTATAAESWLTTIEQVRSPNGVAVFPDGDVLVSEANYNTLKVFDPSGILKMSFHITYPSPVAVDREGHIYIGRGLYSSTSSGAVMVYDREFNYLYSLDADFINPSDIFIDHAGKIYVTDSETHSVKVFLNNGTLLFSFGEHGVGDSYFNTPLAVTVDNGSGDIYVADKQLKLSGVGDYFGSARIQVFTSDGHFIRAFGNYAWGELLSPTDISLFNEKMYITDSIQNRLLVYDPYDGTMLYSLAPPDALMRTPVALDISESGTAYIASLFMNRIYVLSLVDPACFTLSPDTIHFEAAVSGHIPPEQTLSITNCGEQDLTWRITSDSDWITLTEADGEIGSGAAASAGIGVDILHLGEGTHRGTITVTSESGAEETADITLEMFPQPILTVSPSTLFFTTTMFQGDPLPQHISITLIDPMNTALWTASADATWLSVNPVEAAGNGETSVLVTISSAGLQAGTHEGHIVIGTSDGVAGSPAVVDVVVQVSYAGHIQVRTNLDSAQFTVSEMSGAVSFEGYGMEWNSEHVPDGTYTIAYDNVNGYKTPSSETLELSHGGSIVFTGEYIPLERIVATSNSNTRDTINVKILDGNGILLNEFNAFPGEAKAITASVCDVNGDGTNEIIVGVAKGSSSIGIYTAEGIMLDTFNAFDGPEGIAVSCSDLDGDSDGEIVATRKESPAETRVFDYSDHGFIDTGIRITPLDDRPGSSMVASAGDIDGNGRGEIVSLMESGHNTEPVMIIWEVDCSGGDGQWTAVRSAELDRDVHSSFVLADIDRDRADEIITWSRSGTIFILDQGEKLELGDGFHDITGLAVGELDGIHPQELILGYKDGRVGIMPIGGTADSVTRVFSPVTNVSVTTGFLGY